MSNGVQTKLPLVGVLRARQLAALYYGFPMVTTIRETFFAAPSGTLLILEQDPRRISYEIVLTASVALVSVLAAVGSPQSMDTNKAQIYAAQGLTSVVISRNFLTDVDAVTLPLMHRQITGYFDIGVREVLLSPLPNDELNAALAAL